MISHYMTLTPFIFNKDTLWFKAMKSESYTNNLLINIFAKLDSHLPEKNILFALIKTL